MIDEIVKKTREDLERRKQEYPLEWLGRSLAYNPYAPRDVKSALKSTPTKPYRIIAEVKKASPSKGVIFEDFEPVSIAKDYEAGGADALSILTEPHYFHGVLEHLTHVRRYVPMPLLRKDFIVDSYQILESLVYGADFILLIASLLSRKELKELLEYAHHVGLDVLVEIHDREDLTKAIFAGAEIIGINSRNWHTFELDAGLCARLIPLIPQGKIIVAEGEVDSPRILEELGKIGVDAFLIGEHFMRQDNVTQALSDIRPIN